MHVEIQNHPHPHPNPLPRLHERGDQIAWCVLMAAACALLFVCLSTWIIRNPHPRHWDNAEYLCETYRDAQAFHTGGWRGLGHSLVALDPQRPPAYRLLALPMTLAGATGLTPIRFMSLAAFA